MARTGRPRFQVDWDEVEKLCQIHCTQTEICSFLGCSVDTIERAVKREYNTTFAEYYKIHSDGGKRSLRRKMFQIATEGNGNVGMLIWLSKNQLGMRDDPSDSLTTEDAKRVFELAYKISKEPSSGSPDKSE